MIGVLRFAQDDSRNRQRQEQEQQQQQQQEQATTITTAGTGRGKSNSKDRNRQRQKQIPFGNDKQRTCNGKNNSNSWGANILHPTHDDEAVMDGAPGVKA